MTFINQFNDVIVNSTHDIFLFLDTNKKISYTNESVNWILGYTIKEICDKNLQELVIKDDQEILANFFIKFNNRKLCNTCELRLIHKHGFVVWTKATTTFLADNQSDVPIIVLTEITEKKVLEQKLNYCQKQLLGLAQPFKIKTGEYLKIGPGTDINNHLSETIKKIKSPLITLNSLLTDMSYQNTHYESFKNALAIVQLQTEQIEQLLIEINQVFSSQIQ